MIDLHCHLLPGIDDGSRNLAASLAMAQMAVDDGIECITCTPHIYPGRFDNNRDIILSAVENLLTELKTADIPLNLAFGADAHMTPDLLQNIRSGQVPTLNDSRYLLFEPPHHIKPPDFEQFVFNLLANDIIPIITHPERLTWVEDNYDVFIRVADGGAWLQITSNSITGRFGRTVQYWSEKMLDDGVVHIIASDAHSLDRRPPIMSPGRAAAERFVGVEEASRMVLDRPRAVLQNKPPSELPAPPGIADPQYRKQHKTSKGWLRKLLGS